MSIKDQATKSDIEDVRKDIDNVLFAVNNVMKFVQDESERNSETKETISKIFNQLDNFVKRQEISDDERLVMGRQLDRLDRWVHELANKIGYELKV